MSFPFLPGIPPLLSNQLGAAAATIAAPYIAQLLQINAPKWGIYDAAGKVQVLNPDSFLGIEYINSHRVSNYPVEKGSFAYYNTVQDPFSARVKMAIGGSENDRTNFLNTVDTLSTSLNLYTLVTPEKTYANVTIERYDYRRETNNGAGMLVVNIHFLEIRLAILQYSTQPTTVPASQITNSTTTTGTASQTATAPHAQSSLHSGQIAPKSPPAIAVSQYHGASGTFNYNPGVGVISNSAGASGTW